MLSNMAKVLFIVRKSKANTQRYILYCRVSANNLSREFSTEETIHEPALWNQSAQKYEKQGREGEYINLVCDKLKYDIKTIYLSQPSGQVVCPDKIIHLLKTPKKPLYSVAALVRIYIEWEKKYLDLSDETLKHHECYFNNLTAFDKNIYPSEFTLLMAEKFKLFLKVEKNCLHKTRRSRTVEFIKKALDHALQEKNITAHELTYYKAERDKQKENVFLSKQEREDWAKASFKTKTLVECRDLAIYQMCTGIEYGNIWNEFIIKEVPGVGKIMEGKRNKGDKNPFAFPYSDMVDAILKKYNGKLPYYDNSTYNKTIKIIAKDFLGMEKKVTTHVFRKTFSMKMKSEGWSVETISSMLGHRSTRTTETYYMGVSQERLVNEMLTRKI